MGCTLTRDAYVELLGFGEPDEYPKNTAAAKTELRRRGYDATVPALNYLIRQGKVTPARDGSRNYRWLPQDIDLAAQELEARKAYTPLAVCAMVLGIDLVQYHRALHEAMDGVRKEFGQAIAPVRDWLIMHVQRPCLGRDGHVSFTLCDDVRERLKASSHDVGLRSRYVRRLAMCCPDRDVATRANVVR